LPNPTREKPSERGGKPTAGTLGRLPKPDAAPRWAKWGEKNQQGQGGTILKGKTGIESGKVDEKPQPPGGGEGGQYQGSNGQPKQGALNSATNS